MLQNINNYYKTLDITYFIGRKSAEFTNSSDNLNILVLLEKLYGPELDDLLSKILTSTKSISTKLVYRIETYNNLINDDLKNMGTQKFKKIIIFGSIHNLDLNFLFNNYNLTTEQILMAPDVSELVNNVDSRRQLWQNLQSFCKF